MIINRALNIILIAYLETNGTKETNEEKENIR